MSKAENNENRGQPEPTSTDYHDAPDGSSFDPNSIEGLFLATLQKETPAERDAYLDEVCGDDEERRRRVTALLRAYDDAGSFLDTPAGGPRPEDGVSLGFLKTTEKAGCLGTLGPYEVLEVMGRGGMGVVLRAIDPKLNRVVAVKVLLPELATNPNARRRFSREAQAAAAVSHPHVVTIHAVEEAKNGEPSTPPYLVMECVVGQSLQEKLEAVGPLRLEETLRISRQVAEGLAAAHQQGLIHRDIKPANILLENGVERVKITDFGLARAIDDLTVTRTGEVSGTPQYMSPEQASGQRVDHRSDLFSLGCVMYAMCTGHSPFRADSLAHVIKRVTQDTPCPIVKLNSEVPPWLAQIIDCLLAKDADQRFQTATGLVAIVDQHLSRIQQPSDSGAHSLINQSLPAAATAKPSSSADGLAATAATTPEASPEPTAASNAKHTESIHGNVGRYLLTAGSFLLVLPFALIGVGLAITSGDVMQFGGEVMVFALPLAIAGLIFGYILRYIIDKQQDHHQPLNLRLPVIFAFGAAVLAGVIHVVWERDLMRSKPVTTNVRSVVIEEQPVVIIKEIMAERGDQAKIIKNRGNPDFIPLKR